MQTQDAPAEIIFKLWPWLEANKNRLIGVVVALLIISGILYFIAQQKQQRDIEAGDAMTAVMITPESSGVQLATSLEQLADKYSGTMSAQRAQMQAAAVLFDAGKYSDAEAQFEKYLQAHSTGPFAASAQLGVASCLEAENQLDAAASAYQRVISLYGGSTSVPAAEFGLGEIAEQQKKYSEAASHFEAAAKASMGGSMAQEAMLREADLKTKIAAAAPKVGTAQPATPAFKPTPLAPGVATTLTNNP